MPPDHLYIEKELLLMVAHGDQAAFTKVFETYRDKIFTIAYKLSKSQEYAEEITQDVFLKIWLTRGRLTEVIDLPSYLFIITRNHTFMHLKLVARAAKRQIILTRNIPINHFLADNPLLEKDYQSILLEAIDKLSPQQQKVYQLSRTEGLKREEIAAKLGISPETVKIHIGKAMKIIRAYCVSRLNPPLILFFVYNYL